MLRLHALLGILGLAALPCFAQTMTIYLGTFTNTGSQGLYYATFDSAAGRLSPPLLAAKLRDPSFLALSPDRRSLYAVSTGADSVSRFTLGPTGDLTLLGVQPSGSEGPCHVAVDATGRTLVTANYNQGGIDVYPLALDGTIGQSTAHRPLTFFTGVHARQEKSHAHGVTFSPDGHFLLVPDLGADRIYFYRHTGEGTLAPSDPTFLELPPGSGPRHVVFAADGRYAYILNELTSTLTVCTWQADAGSLAIAQHIDLLPTEFTGTNTAAELVISPDERTVYASNRGHDSLVVFARDLDTGRLSFRQRLSSGGRGPRHFAVSPDGRWLIAANQDSENLAVFRIDHTTGLLSPHGESVALPRPVCVLFVP